MREEADKNSKLKDLLKTQMEVADEKSKLETQIREVEDKISELEGLIPSKTDILCVELAGLCHDLGKIYF